MGKHLLSIQQPFIILWRYKKTKSSSFIYSIKNEKGLVTVYHIKVSNKNWEIFLIRVSFFFKMNFLFFLILKFIKFFQL